MLKAPRNGDGLPPLGGAPPVRRHCQGGGFAPADGDSVGSAESGASVAARLASEAEAAARESLKRKAEDDQWQEIFDMCGEGDCPPGPRRHLRGKAQAQSRDGAWVTKIVKIKF